MARDGKGRFMKVKEDLEDFLDLCYLGLKLTIVIGVCYMIFSYFELSSKVNDFFLYFLVPKDCELNCKNGKRSNGYWSS